MNLLTLDTSSIWLKVALEVDGGEMRSTVTKSKNRHSDFLMMEIDRTLKFFGMEVADLDAVGCVTGPGHFTGIRSGIATVKAMSFAHSIPIIGVPYAECVVTKEPIVLLRKARMGWVYVSEYDGKSWTYSMNSVDFVVKHLSGKKILSEEIVNGEKIEIITGPLFTGFDMIEAMKRAFKNKMHVYNHLNIKPFYVQKPIAEEKLAKKRDTEHEKKFE